MHSFHAAFEMSYSALLLRLRYVFGERRYSAPSGSSAEATGFRPTVKLKMRESDGKSPYRKLIRSLSRLWVGVVIPLMRC